MGEAGEATQSGTGPGDPSSIPLTPVESVGVLGSLLRLGLVGLGVAAVCFLIVGIFRVNLGAGLEEMLGQLTRGNAQARALAAADILQLIRTTSAGERKRAGIEDSILGRKLLVALRGLDEDEEEPRVSLVLALGRLKSSEGVADLVRLLGRTKSGSARVRASAAFSLGEIGQGRAVSALLASTRSGNAGVRKEAAMALGKLGDETAVPDISILLKDNELSVKWSAALALARLGDSGGKEVYRAMLNRELLDNRSDMSEEERTGVMVSALHAVSALRLTEYEQLVRIVGKKDRNLQVRSEAMKVLAVLGK